MNLKFTLLIMLFLGSIHLFAQKEQIILLEKKIETLEGTEKLDNLLQLSRLYYKADRARKSLEIAIKVEEIAKKVKDKNYEARALSLEGDAYLAINQKRYLNKAKSKYKKSLKLAKKVKNTNLAIENLEALKAIADSYADKRDYEKQIAVLEGRNPNDVGLVNPGSTKEKKLTEVEKENEALKNKVNTLDEVSSVLAQEKELLALEKLELHEEREQLNSMINRKEKEINEMNEQQAKSELLVAQQKNILDSLRYIQLYDQMQLEKQNFILGQKETQLKEQTAKLDLQRSQKNLLLALAALVFLLAIGLFTRYLGIKKYNTILETKNEVIREEQARSEQLLLNILPAKIASELKDKGEVETAQFEEATVLFSDFKDFSRISKTLSPVQLVADLDYCFKGFDKIIGKYGMEKIKTIGDAYMCAGGIPVPNPNHPVDVINAALEMQEFLEEWREQKIANNEPFFEARIGIHTGPIIAGVVGDKKFAYDIWGDTVNIAARMETCSLPGKVNISHATYQKVKPHFSFEERGKVPAKNVGEIEMYFVDVKGEAAPAGNS